MGHLRMGLANGNSADGKLMPQVWTSVKSRLSEMATEGCIPCFDSYHAIEYENQFSRHFFSSCVGKINDAWEGIKLKVIPDDKILGRVAACI